MRKSVLGKRVLSLVVAVAVVTSGFALYESKDSNQVYAASNKPSIEKVEYEGKGKVDVEFYGNVRYSNVKVKVERMDTGKAYNGDIVKKDSDDIEFRSPSYKSGIKYKFTISGIKRAGAKSYTSVSGHFQVPKAGSIKIEEIEYDPEDRELSVEFRTKVSWKNTKVKIYNANGDYVCSSTILEKENDSIEVRLGKRLTYGKKYVCKISGVKSKTGSEYKTISKSFYAVD